MKTLVSIPVLVIFVMFQTAIFSRLSLGSGSADIVLLALAAWALQDHVHDFWIWTLLAGLMITFISATPAFIPLISYLILTGFVRIMHHRIWQTPILAMFVASLFGTLVFHGLSFVALTFLGTNIPLGEAITQITFPSALLNLIFALPVYALMSELARRLNPREVN